VKEISDYAIIGDCRSAALVSRDGSIDWLCWPRFDSPSIFGALLDEGAGRWSISPTAPFRAERRYVENSNVLQTRFLTEAGALLLTDLMPVASEEDKRRFWVADHEILRIIECEQGEVEVEMRFEPRPKYRQARSKMKNAGKLGLRFEIGSSLLVLRSDMPLDSSRNGDVRARIHLRQGQAFHTSVTFADELPAILPPLGASSREAVSRSVSWWRSWLSPLTYNGPAREAVIRSALALKLLVYAPSGAIVASPTTSLPERIGGDLNWDYRFCWLRDASLTVRALFELGFFDEAEAFVSWLLQATRLTQPELRILYDVHGNRPSREHTLDHFTGYRGSRPVRVGNAAVEQFQLDVYGEVLDATTQLVRKGKTLDRETQRMLCAFGDYVCRHWQQPDDGIWEPRSGKGHNTHSRVLCWTALDRLIELGDQGHIPKVAEFEKHRALIRRDIEARAWNSRLKSYVARLDGEQVDASSLLLPWYGFEHPSSDRMRQTYARIREKLGAGGVLLYRFRTQDSPVEGAFGVCSFWGAEYLALGGGTTEEAQGALQQLCGYANDVGLFAEEIDPQTGKALGNFPQAFTHVGLINAALSLSRRLEGRELLARRVPLRDVKHKRPEPRP